MWSEEHLQARLLLRGRARHHLRRRAEDRADERVVRELAPGPEEEVGAQRRVEQEHRPARRAHRRLLVRSRRVGGGNEQHQGRRAIGETQRELQRRRSAGRDTEDRGLLDVQGVEQAGVGVGLGGRRGVGGKRRPEVAEARHRDHAKAGAGKRIAELEALVEPTARAVHDQDGRAFARHGVFDRPATRPRDLTTGRDSLERRPDVAAIARVGQRQQAAGDDGRR